MVDFRHRLFGYGKSEAEQRQRKEDRIETEAEKETQKQYKTRLSLARQRERLKTADTIAKIEERQYIDRVRAGKPSGIMGKVTGALTAPVSESQIRMFGGSTGGSGGWGNMWGGSPKAERKSNNKSGTTAVVNGVRITTNKKGKKHKTTRTRKPNTAKPDYSGWMP